jgi:DNA-binding PadR family transcriptional regulator
MSRYERERRRQEFERHVDPENGDYPWQSYWEDWREAVRQTRHSFSHHSGHDHSPEELAMWREFFFQYFGVWPEQHWIFSGRRFGPWQQGMESFNPFVANLLSKGGGLLPLYVLHLVSQKPRYGNEIMEILAERTNGQWVSNPGAIYPLMTQLEMEGFIKGEWADPSKRTVRTYTITPTGTQELDRLKKIVAPKIDETIGVLEVFLDDLLGEAEKESPSENPTEEPEK